MIMMNSSQDFNCLFCKDTFDSKEELQVHFRKHGDPKFNQSVKSKIQNEMATSDEKSEEKELVSCDVCTEVFPTISKAITHKHKVHPDHDAKYFCPWCGKLFTMKHLYNKHIQSNHDKEENKGSGFHCDYCDVDFFVPSAMLYHNKFFHRQDTELAAIGHSKKLKMHNQEPLPIYYCPFCGEEYSNKVNLHKHMGDDHIDENQSPEDVLRCPLCEAVFYHLDAYELHLTFHSSEDVYGEENSMANEITEFSLETVPPIMEKIENESQEEGNGDTIGIEELLQQAMNESNDNEDGSREKKKKHKKHKKSKKSAITLDEFLTMNTDVFGEGLDFQGIEEVPTQVVAKQLKKKVPQKIRTRQKAVPSAELERLKKLGIAVKKKPVSNVNRLQGVKVVNKTPLNAINATKNVNTNPKVQTKTDVPNDILSKLANSQIKVVKKSAQGTEEISPTDKGPPDNKNSTRDEDEVSNNKNNELQTLQIEKDKINNIAKEPQNVLKETLDDTIDEHHHDDFTLQEEANTETSNVTQNEMSLDKSGNTDIKTTVNNYPSMDTNVKKEDNNCKEKNDALRNISQHITIKPVLSPKSVISNLKSKLMEELDIENKRTNEAHSENDSIESKHIDSVANKNVTDSWKNKDSESSYSALKHLSHLTVKPVNQSKNNISPTDQKISKTDTKANETSDGVISNKEQLETFRENNHIRADHKTNVTSASPKLGALKNLSKTITIKTVPQSPNCSKNNTAEPVNDFSDDEFEHYDEFDDDDELELDDSKKVFPTKVMPNIIKTKTPEVNTSSPKSVMKSQINNEMQVMKYDESDLSKKTSCASILQKIPNITAKPASTMKSVKTSATFTSQSVNIQKSNMIQSTIKKEKTKQEEVEIFNIDDSDEEHSGPQNIIKKQASNAPVIAKKIPAFSNKSPTNIIKQAVNKNSNTSADVLRNLSKHVTIKPTASNTPVKHENLPEDDEMSDEDFDDSVAKEFEEPIKKSVNEKNALLQNKLKTLNNITVKSTNSLPKPDISSSVNKNNDMQDNDDSDSDTSAQVKITELPDDFCSDDDIPLVNSKSNRNVTVQEPTDSDEETHKDFEEALDFENEIKPNTLKKPVQTSSKTSVQESTPTPVKKSGIKESAKTPAFLNKLKNITVKSLRENKSELENEETSETEQKEKPITPSLNKNMSIKPVIQTTHKGTQGTVHKNVSNVSKSSDQVNTHKQVTVKTFQTKTVIEETVTTVTKTIRTVNQTVNQEFKNVAHSSATFIRPQRIQGTRPQQIKNYQGVPVRPPAPTMGQRIRSPRPPVGTQIRPSNQLVPARPSMNVARMSQPRLPKKPPTAMNVPHQPVLGKPLKIAPNAMFSSPKRPAPDESNGPFSCFKKAKESLVPGSDMPVFNSNLNDSGAHFASSSHFSRTDFASSTMSVKGNTVMKSSQMKSEVSSSCEQLSKLNSMSGLKVVRSSQNKQASKVEEKTEINSAKRTTLDAIEKLQKQGLLVKKPRIEEPNDSEHSDAGDEYYDDNDGEF